MSYQSFEKALELAKYCSGYFTHGAKIDKEIEYSEKQLEIKFSQQNRDYYRSIGYLSFEGCEIYGIYPDGDSKVLVGDSYASALHDRKCYNLPHNWLPIYDFDDGYMGYLDYSQLNEEGEPPVIMAIYNGEKYVVVEKVAEDFGDFLLQIVEEQLARQ